MSEADNPEVDANFAPAQRGPSENITELFGRGGKSRAGGPAAAPVNITFDRVELREILGLYGRKVAETEWRDYAMNFTPQKAIFSVFRRSSEMPLYRIEKDPALSTRQGTYSVVVATGLILRRGNDLKRVLAVLEKKPRLVVV